LKYSVQTCNTEYGSVLCFISMTEHIYFTMCLFRRAFILTVYFISRLTTLNKAKHRKDTQEGWRQTDEECDCHRSLRNSEYEEYKNINAARLEGTCQWFLKHQNYDSWQKGNASSLLWVSANPGCGKSVLSRFLVDKAANYAVTHYLLFLL
jgi:hypothetical protein